MVHVIMYITVNETPFLLSTCYQNSPTTTLPHPHPPSPPLSLTTTLPHHHPPSPPLSLTTTLPHHHPPSPPLSPTTTFPHHHSPSPPPSLTTTLPHHHSPSPPLSPPSTPERRVRHGTGSSRRQFHSSPANEQADLNQLQDHVLLCDLCYHTVLPGVLLHWPYHRYQGRMTSINLNQRNNRTIQFIITQFLLFTCVYFFLILLYP